MSEQKGEVPARRRYGDDGRILIDKVATAAAVDQTPAGARDPAFDQHRQWPNVLAFGYILVAYGLGLACVLMGDGVKRWLFGVPLLAHGMTMAAYMVHECAHSSIFAFKSGHTLHKWALNNRKETHAVMGTVMTWVCGAVYAPFHVLQYCHLRHHKTTADITSWDFHTLLDHPSLAGRALRQLTLAAEWAYIPLVEWIMHGYVMVAPFVRPCPEFRHYRGRGRVVALFAIRVGLFIWLTSSGDRIWALLAYVLSYSIMLQILRFGDAFQHTYDTVVADPKTGKASVEDDRINRKEEQAKTFSNIAVAAHTPMGITAEERLKVVEGQASEGFLALACDLCNLVLHLNFGFHNGHHDMQTVPWHALPHHHRTSVHKPVYNEQTLALSTLLRLFHSHRVERVLATTYGKTPGEDLSGFIGAIGVSFLTTI